MLQPKILIQIIELLNKNRIDYMITGSIVSSLQGEPRSTHDTDIVINIKQSAVQIFVESFPPPDYYVDESSIKEAISQNGMFNLIDTNEGDKFDFWVLTNDEFDLRRFKRKIKEKLFGTELNVSAPEDTVLAKLKWCKLSGGSNKQYTDALRVFEVQYEKLDMEYLKKWAEKLSVQDLYEKLIDEAEPLK